MRAYENLALDTSKNEHSDGKRKTTCCPGSKVETSHYAAHARTTTHRYFLTNKLVVKASIDWTSSEEQSDTVAFFRTVAHRLIGIY